MQRLRPEFERVLNRMLSAEEWQFHDSGFAAPVMLPPSGLGAWLHAGPPWHAKLYGRWGDLTRYCRST